MEATKTVCLLNDSFPPLIDGVANTVVNYGKHLPAAGFSPAVITPACEDADDSRFPYPVARYPSLSHLKLNGYPTGIPFSAEVARTIADREVAILHTHCPIISTLMARQLRKTKDAPVILTYHTKFDIDIANVVKSQALQAACKKVIVENISACDEVWTVSKGAGENLRELGYEGNFTVMPNGADLSVGTATKAQISTATSGLDLPEGVPVYLFVGRMMWYKGLRLLINALVRLKVRGLPFRMVFVGDGTQRKEIEAYAQEMGIGHLCIFTGAIHDREVLRAFYTRADLFLIPSVYDTNGLVVREAAACSLASVLIEGSCAAEGITDGRNGFLVPEDEQALAARLAGLSAEVMAQVGSNACREIYLSWEDAVKIAAEHYREISARYARGEYPRRIRPIDSLLTVNGELMDALARLSTLRHK